jgi:peptidoglycan-associated lipoprotein
MKLKSLSTLALAVVLAAGVVGCKKKMDRVTPLPGYGAANTMRDPNAEGLNGLARPGGENMAGNNNPIGTARTDNMGNIEQTGARDITGRPQDREKYRAQTVYFDFDRSNVKASEAHKVEEVANRFKQENAATDLLIEGHCDERGTEGYNQALGERRALAIREMLVSLGVTADRIHTVSFGKDKPAETGHNEAAWSKNRRGEFILVLPK